MELHKEICAILGYTGDVSPEQIGQLKDLVDKCVALRAVNVMNAFLDADARSVNTMVNQYTVCSPQLVDTALMVTKFADLYAINILGIIQGILGQHYFLKPVANSIVGINSVSNITHFDIITIPKQEQE